MTTSLCSRAIFRISSISAGWPKIWTTMIALVRGVISARSFAGSRLKVSDSMSQKTGIPL